MYSLRAAHYGLIHNLSPRLIKTRHEGAEVLHVSMVVLQAGTNGGVQNSVVHVVVIVYQKAAQGIAVRSYEKPLASAREHSHLPTFTR